MDQLKRLIEKLSWAQRIFLVAAVIGVIGGVVELSRWNQERNFRALFTALSAEDAGSLVSKLKEGGFDYRLANNGSTILVASDRVAEARLTMAAAGLPKTGRIGFELFDRTDFGASEFTEQVNYHRAIEGELERSVMSLREVERARAHITLAKDSIYTELREPAKASILVKLRPGADLSPQNVAAICQLTASAVPQLSPEQVSVVDTNGNLLNRAKRALASTDSDAADGALDYRKSVEKDVQTKIAMTLEPLLGLEHFRAGVSADVDMTSGDQSEETFDPQKSVIATSQTTQDGPALPAASGVPGTPSNLPPPVSRSVTGTSNYTRKTENVTYQTSRLVKHVKLPQGIVKRLSISVLVDHSTRQDGSKRIIESPSAEKLKVIRDMVAATTGFDMNRGDQLVVEAFPFESTLNPEATNLGPSPSGAPSNQPEWLRKLLGQKNFILIAGIAATAVLLLLGGLAFLLLRGGKKKTVAVDAAAELEAAKPKELGPTPDEVQRQIEAQMAEQAAQQARKEAEELMKLKMPEVSTKKTQVLTKHISSEAKRDPIAMAQVVRSWISGDER